MTAQVVFLNTGHQPSAEDAKRFAYYQEQLELYHAELAYKTRDWEKGEKIIYKNNSHSNIRNSWTLVLGTK